MPKLVRQLRMQIEGVPDHFTLEACPHAGLTELEEVESEETRGRAPSGHMSAQSYRGYAKVAIRRPWDQHNGAWGTVDRTNRRHNFEEFREVPAKCLFGW